MILSSSSKVRIFYKESGVFIFGVKGSKGEAMVCMSSTGKEIGSRRISDKWSRDGGRGGGEEKLDDPAHIPRVREPTARAGMASQKELACQFP